MPAFADLPELQRWALVAYLRRLSPEFARRTDVDPLPIPTVPADLNRRAARGGDLFGRMQCNTCHGESGRGNGPAAATLTDEDGLPVRTPDFVVNPLKYGNAPEDIYRTLVTGLDGTPMPSYAGALAEEEVWDIVAFVRLLVGDHSSPRISTRDVAEARAFVAAQQRQASHAVVDGCGCRARRR
jgi:mono/diheme cytochrome c family protein